MFWTKFMCENGEKMQRVVYLINFIEGYFFILKIRCNTNFINCSTHLVQRAMWSIVITLCPSSVWSWAFYTFFLLWNHSTISKEALREYSFKRASFFILCGDWNFFFTKLIKSKLYRVKEIRNLNPQDIRSCELWGITGPN